LIDTLKMARVLERAGLNREGARLGALETNVAAIAAKLDAR
jgi:hypothetical protein